MPGWLDLPPVWLALFVGMAWVQAEALPIGGVPHGLSDLIAGLLVGAGLLLILLAAVEMRRYATTIIPHRAPKALVSTGIFRRSRNPIYLGDTLILTGLIFKWQAWLALVLVPLFVYVLTDRFIRPEEATLDETFPGQFKAYAGATRRWL